MSVQQAEPVNALGEKRGRTACVYTLGCRSNQYDSTAIEDIVRQNEFEIVPFPGPADVYIINTCTVTARTDSQSRQVIRRARRVSPDAVIIVTGCYAQVSPSDVVAIEGVDYVLGNPEKDRVAECMVKGRPAGGPRSIVGSYLKGTPLTLRARSPRGRTRANLKVQDGCDKSCTYCIIPRARGVSRSVEPGLIQQEIEGFIEKGFREIVLTGIHLGSYGTDLTARLSLADLMTVIEEKNYPCRFRISSMDPDEVDDTLITLMARAKTICNHLHMALQSGDDAIIGRMDRSYTTNDIRSIVGRLAHSVAGISIGADIIVGFPGETDVEFENTVALLESLPIAYLHIFPFSPRGGTPAALMPAQVDVATVKRRCMRLKDIDAMKRRAFHESFMGETLSVLIESKRDKTTGLLKGRAKNYILVLIEGTEAKANTVQQVRVVETNERFIRGRI